MVNPGVGGQPSPQPAHWGYDIDPATGVSRATYPGEVVGAVSGAYYNLAAASGANINGGTSIVTTSGYYAPGDGGGGSYIKSGTPGAGPGKFQSADGQWWILSSVYINVRQFGCKGDGVTNDGAAFQAAINFSVNRELFVPIGTYAIGQTLTTPAGSAIRLYGEVRDQYSSTILYTGVGTMLTVPFAAEAFEMSDINLACAGSGGVGTGAVAVQINCARAILERLNCRSANAFTTALISTWQVSPNYQYYTEIKDCYFDNTNTLTNNAATCILAGPGHSLIINGCMFSGYNKSISLLDNGGAQTLYGMFVSNCRFEAFAGVVSGYTGGANAVGIEVPAICYGLNVAGCDFEYGDNNAVGQSQRAMKFAGTVKGGSITGCSFNGGGQCLSMIEIASANVAALSIVGNSFYRAVEGITISGGGKFSLQQIGVNWTHAGLTDLYNNTFIPSVQFGGASVGVTTSAATGYYQRVGNYITFSINIVLTSKGSSTGAMTIAGLPFTSASQGAFSGETACALDMNNIAAGLAPSAFIIGNSSIISLRNMFANALMTDASATNTTSIRVTGSVLVNSAN